MSNDTVPVAPVKSAKFVADKVIAEPPMRDWDVPTTDINWELVGEIIAILPPGVLSIVVQLPL